MKNFERNLFKELAGQTTDFPIIKMATGHALNDVMTKLNLLAHHQPTTPQEAIASFDQAIQILGQTADFMKVLKTAAEAALVTSDKTVSPGTIDEHFTQVVSGWFLKQKLTVICVEKISDCYLINFKHADKVLYHPSIYNVSEEIIVGLRKVGVKDTHVQIHCNQLPNYQSGRKELLTVFRKGDNIRLYSVYREEDKTVSIAFKQDKLSLLESVFNAV